MIYYYRVAITKRIINTLADWLSQNDGNYNKIV